MSYVRHMSSVSLVFKVVSPSLSMSATMICWLFHVSEVVPVMTAGVNVWPCSIAFNNSSWSISVVAVASLFRMVATSDDFGLFVNCL